MKYIIPIIYRFTAAILASMFAILLFCIIQIAYTLWTFKLKLFTNDWFVDQNIWEYDANDQFEKDPKKIYKSPFHWAMDSLPKKKVIEITKEPFLNK